MESKHDGKSIAFAFYKNNELIGYRLDTVGSIRKEHPKIYGYSKEQVDIVLKNVNYNISNSTGIGAALKRCGATGEVIEGLIKNENKIHEMLQDKRAFELRVVECPGYEKDENGFPIWGTYPHGAIEEWMQYPDLHVVIETHYFTMDGQLNMQ